MITKSRLTFLTNLTFYMVGRLKIRNMNIAEYCLFSVCLRCTIMQGSQGKVRKNNFCTKYFQYFQPSHFCHFILEVSIYCQALKNLIFHWTLLFFFSLWILKFFIYLLKHFHKNIRCLRFNLRKSHVKRGHNETSINV